MACMKKNTGARTKKILYIRKISNGDHKTKILYRKIIMSKK
jgi:hypothetical protein